MAWEAYLALEPSGDERLDWLFASIREMIYNVAVKKEDRKPIKDFKLEFTEAQEKKKQSVEDQILIAKLWVASSDVDYADNDK